ncbi:hypothetical protein ABK040_008605 [Willaertia magna]
MSNPHKYFQSQVSTTLLDSYFQARIEKEKEKNEKLLKENLKQKDDKPIETRVAKYKASLAKKSETEPNLRTLALPSIHEAKEIIRKHQQTFEATEKTKKNTPLVGSSSFYSIKW